MFNKSELFECIGKIENGNVKSWKYAEKLRVLIDRGLVRWINDHPEVTEKGRQFIFKNDCERVLKLIDKGIVSEYSEDALKWLTVHQFIIQKPHLELAWKVTPRGRDWLCQME